MRHRFPSIAPALVLALVSASLAGCAEMHRGAEAVGRIGASPAPVAEEAEAAPVARADVKTVRPRGARRAPGADTAAVAPADTAAVAPADTAAVAPADTAAVAPSEVPTVVAAVPSPRQIFDFHPAGSRPDSWRQPFVIDTNDGPLAADVRRSAAELRTFLADRKAGDARTARTQAAKLDAAKADRIPTGTTRKICGEMDVAANKPGCGVPRPPATAPAVP